MYRGALDDAVAEVDTAVATEWNGFVGRVTRIGRVEVPGLQLQPVRFEIKLTFKGKPFSTVPMEVAAPEGDALRRVDTVEVSLDPVGLPVPPTVPCLSVRYQIAQKLHACTDPLEGQLPNDRAHDLAHLILLEELLDADLVDVRAACVDVFSIRDRQPWPPALVAPPHWPRLWNAIVEEDHFPVIALHEAVERVRALIERIDAASAG